jgi:hypothetical protein
MTMTHAKTLVSLATLAMLVACRDVAPVAPKPTAAAPSAVAQRVAYLSVSDLTPEPGAIVVVGARVGVGDSLSLASFRVRLSYDRDALHFVDEVPLPGMMRVVNPQPDQIIVVGASGEESSDGRLFAVRFRVDDAAGLETLALLVDELNDRSFVSRVGVLKQSPRLVLDRKLAPAR